jgi:uncharacterized DUF497 family protein
MKPTWIKWNRDKYLRNLKKHGVDFEIAQLVFNDPHQLTEQDRVEGYEYRWQTIGMVDDIMLFVAYTFEYNDGEEIINIISARDVTAKERRRYHETPSFA